MQQSPSRNKGKEDLILKDQELLQHLEHLENQLSKLLISYRDYQLRGKQKKQKLIPVIQHILILLAILIIVIVVTYAVSSILHAGEYFLYIGIAQSVLAIGLYQYLMKRIMKDRVLSADQQTTGNDNVSLYELDQQRFEVLQEIATSPVPPHYMTPKAIKVMNQLVQKGFCHTLEECIITLDIEGKKHRYEEEINLINQLQTISYH